MNRSHDSWLKCGARALVRSPPRSPEGDPSKNFGLLAISCRYPPSTTWTWIAFAGQGKGIYPLPASQLRRPIDETSAASAHPAVVAPVAIAILCEPIVE